MSQTTIQDVTDAELAVLEVLWAENTATVRHITDTLYADSVKPQHSTVQKLLDRLSTKGFVARDRTVWPHMFRPAIKREELLDKRLQSTADKLCGGSVRPILTRLLKGTKLTKEERQSLRGLLDELED